MNRAAMIRSLLLTVAALGAPLPAAAQTPRIEVSGGYQFLNISADLESFDATLATFRSGMSISRCQPAGTLILPGI